MDGVVRGKMAVKGEETVVRSVIDYAAVLGFAPSVKLYLRASKAMMRYLAPGKDSDQWKSHDLP